MQNSKPDIHELTAQAVSLQERLAKIAAEPGSFAHGLQDVGRGLHTLLENLPSEESTDPSKEKPRDSIMRAHLIALLHGLEGIADYLTNTDSDDEITHAQPAAPANAFAGLHQFIAAFRKEAQKRLAGLSISMMGIFNEQNSAPALEQSAGHLHAVRGGAAMLGLTDIADLAATMEQLMVTMGRIDATDRIWPTKTLMQGYALLRAAADDADARIDATATATIVSALRNCLAELAPCVSFQENSAASSAVLRHASGNDSSSAEDSTAKETAAKTSSENAIERLPGNGENAQPHIKDYEQRILIVDDIDTIAASVGFVLADLDVAMDVAHDGQIALKMLREQPYSLIISDVAMPNMTGLELTRAVREDEQLKHLPLILLTSLSQTDERQAGIDAGATDYLIKGEIGGGALIRRVEELLKIAPFVASRNEVHHWKILVAEDTETVAASIAFVLSEGPFDITLAHDGQDAFRHLQHRQYDLLITDVQMPRMNGLELTEAVRAQESMQHMPIIMLTSLDADDDRNRGLAVGVDRYLIKGEIAGGKLLSMMDALLTSGRDL